MVRAETEPPAFLSSSVAGIVAPVALFAALAVRASSVEASGAEQDFVEWLYRQTLSVHGAVDLFLAVGRLGGLLLFGLFALGLMARGRARESLFLVSALAGAAALAAVTKIVVNDVSTAPDGARLDFPSGHAAASLAALVAALALLGDRVRPLAATLGIGVLVAYAAALVARNWHCPSEVLAGWCLGLAWLSVVGLGATFLGSGHLSSSATAAKGA